MAELVDALGLGSSGFIRGGSSPLLGTLGGIMSLISQKDRDLAIEALDFYLFNKQFDFTEEKRMEVNALINWIKLENTKYEN